MINYGTVTVHYPDGKEFTYTSQTLDDPIWNIGRFKFDKNTGVYEESGKLEKCNGYFEVVEKSEDGHDVWVEFIDYP